MGYLGLDQTEVKDDNLFQRIFWPSDQPSEVDALGQRGFWICLVVGVVSCAVMVAQGHWLIGLLTVSFYVLGGIGVREHSQPAATLVAAAYLVDSMATVASGRPPGVLQIACALILLSNIRATHIAAKWAASGDPDTMPERLDTSFADRLVDRLPARVWPRARVSFFVLAGVYMLFAVLGFVLIAYGVSQRSAAQPVPQNSTTIELPVTQ